MPIEIPNELRPVASILGGVEWPDGDEDKLYRLHQSWSAEVAHARQLAERTEGLIARIEETGPATQAMAKVVELLRANANDLRDLAAFCDSLSTHCRAQATVTQHTKLVIVVTFAVLAMQLAVDVACFPGGMAAAAVHRARAGAAVRFAANRLASESLAVATAAGARRAALLSFSKVAVLGTAMGGGFGAGIDGAAQLYQIARGRRDGLDLASLQQAAVGGMLGGFGGASAAALLTPWAARTAGRFGNRLARIAVHAGAMSMVGGVGGLVGGAFALVPAVRNGMTAEQIRSALTNGFWGGLLGSATSSAIVPTGIRPRVPDNLRLPDRVADSTAPAAGHVLAPEPGTVAWIDKVRSDWSSTLESSSGVRSAVDMVAATDALIRSDPQRAAEAWRTAEFFGLPARAEHDLDNAITLGEVAHLQELAKTHPGYGTVPAARLLSDISTELTGHADPYHLLLRYREAWIESGTPTSLADLAPRTPEAGTGWGSWDRSDPAEYMTRNYWGYWEDGRWQGDSFSPPRFVEGTYVHDTLIIPKVHEAMAKLGIEIRSIDNVHEFAGANLYPGMAIMPFVKSGEGRYIAFTYTGSPKEHQVWRAAAGDGTYRYRDSHGIPRSMHLPTVFSEHQKVIADSGARHFPGTPDAFRNTVHTLSVSADIREGDGFDYAPASPGAVTAPAVQRKRWAVEAYVFESVSSEPKVEWQGTEAVVNAAEHGFVSYRMSNTPGHDNASYFMGDQSFPKTPLYRERWANFLDGHPRVKAWREVVSLDGDLPPGVRSVSIGEDGLAAYVVTLYDHPELLGRTYTWAHPERIAHDGIPPGAPGDPPTPPPSGALAYPSGNVDSATAKSVVIAQLSTLLPGRSPELIGASHNVMRALVTQAKPGTDPVAPTVRVVYGPGGPRVRIEVPGIGELPQLAAFRPFRSGIVVDDDRRMSGWAEVAAAPGAARDIGADLARGQGHEIRAASAGRVQADPATAIRNHLRDVLGPDRSRRQDAIGLGAVAAEWAAASSDGRIGVRVESTNERIRVAVDVTVLMSGTHNRTADAAFLASAMYTANASGIDLQPLSGRVVRKTLWFELNGRAAGPSTDPTSGSDTPAPPSR